MSRKGQQKIIDEFAWIIFIAVGFVLIVTIIFAATTPAPIIEPKSSSLVLAKGDSHSFTVTIRSADGGKIQNVTLTSFGEIKDWITFDKISFDLENSTSARVRIKVPPTASLRTYTGGVKVESKGGSSIMSMTISVASQSSLILESRPISLGSLNIVHEKGSEVVESRQDFEVTKGLFSGSKQSFSVSIPDDKFSIMTDANLEILILETNKRGNLIVEFNGQKLYDGKPNVGKLIVPIGKDLVNSTNVVNILTTGPSIFTFWSKSVYKIEDASFVIDFRDTIEREKPFSLFLNEIQNFDHFVFQSRVMEYSTPIEELIIKINNQLVFAEKPPLTTFNQTIRKDILGNNLVVDEENTISFSFDKNAFINLEDMFIVVYYS